MANQLPATALIPRKKKIGNSASCLFESTLLAKVFRQFEKMGYSRGKNNSIHSYPILKLKKFLMGLGFHTHSPPFSQYTFSIKNYV